MDVLNSIIGKTSPRQPGSVRDTGRAEAATVEESRAFESELLQAKGEGDGDGSKSVVHRSGGGEEKEKSDVADHAAPAIPASVGEMLQSRIRSAASAGEPAGKKAGIVEGALKGKAAESTPGEGKAQAGLTGLRPERNGKGERLQVAGMNTASVFTGPGPWNQSWVFEGMQSRDALIPGGESPAAGTTSPQGRLAPDVRKALMGSDSKTALPEEAQAITLDALNALKAKSEASVAVTGSQSPGVDPTAALQGNAAAHAGDSVPKPMEMQRWEAPRTAPAGSPALPVGSPILALGELSTQAAGLEGSIEAVATRGEIPSRQPTSASAAAGRARLAGVMGGDEFIRAKDGIKIQPGEERLNRELPRAPLSELSTAQTAPAGAASPGLSHSSNSSGAVMQPAMEVKGEVVPGAMMRERLSSAALTNVSTGIAELKGSGGGEMRIRLNPEALGEVHLQVSTQGNHVGLKIRATSTEARRVIEESMGHLRESLSSQSLQLGRVEVSVAQPATASAFAGNAGGDSFSGFFDAQSGGSQRGDAQGQDQAARRQDLEPEVDSRPLRMSHPMAERTTGTDGGRRLDVRA